MLQFITHPSDKYSIPEEVQMVLEGGCKWIQLRMKEASDEEFRETALEIIPMCKENEAFLVFDDRVELAMELSVHGVHLGKNDMNPLVARETMGAEAIIGCTANTAADIIAFRGWDSGLCRSRSLPLHHHQSRSLPRNRTRWLPLDSQRGARRRHPAPYSGHRRYNLEDIPSIMETGVNGVAMSGAIINAPDPVDYTRRVLASLQEASRKINGK